MIEIDRVIEFDPSTKVLHPNASGTNLTLSGALVGVSAEFSSGINVGTAVNQVVTAGYMNITDGANGAVIRAYDGTYRTIDFDSTKIRFKYSSALFLTFDYSNNVINPNADDTVDLGYTSIYRFKNFYGRGLALGVGGNTPSAGQIWLSAGAAGGVITSYDTSTYRPITLNASYHAWQTSASEKMRLDATGRLLLQSATALGWQSSTYSALQLGAVSGIQYGLTTDLPMNFMHNMYYDGTNYKNAINALGGFLEIGDYAVNWWDIPAGAAGTNQTPVNMFAINHNYFQYNYGELRLGKSGAKGIIKGYYNSSYQQLDYDATVHTFLISGSEKARFHTTTGYLGILSTAPTAPITIRNNWISSIGQIRLEATDYAGWSVWDQSGNHQGANYYDVSNDSWNWTSASTTVRTYSFDVSHASQTAMFFGPKTVVGYDGTNTHYAANGYYAGAGGWIRRAAVASAGMLTLSDSLTTTGYTGFVFYANSNTTATAGSAFAPNQLAAISHYYGTSNQYALYLGSNSPSTTNYALLHDNTNVIINANSSGEVYVRRGNTNFAQTMVGSAYAWYCHGSVYTTGSYQPSDERLKTNINPIGSTLDKLMQVDPISFEWIDTIQKRNIGTSGTQVGINAQQVIGLFPDVINTIRHPNEGIDKQYHLPDTDFYTADYSKLSVYTLAGLQELVTLLKSRGVI